MGMHAKFALVVAVAAPVVGPPAAAQQTRRPPPAPGSAWRALRFARDADVRALPPGDSAVRVTVNAVGPALALAFNNPCGERPGARAAVRRDTIRIEVTGLERVRVCPGVFAPEARHAPLPPLRPGTYAVRVAFRGAAGVWAVHRRRLRQP